MSVGCTDYRVWIAIARGIDQREGQENGCARVHQGKRRKRGRVLASRRIANLTRNGTMIASKNFKMIEKSLLRRHWTHKIILWPIGMESVHLCQGEQYIMSTVHKTRFYDRVPCILAEGLPEANILAEVKPSFHRQCSYAAFSLEMMKDIISPHNHAKYTYHHEIG